MNHKVELPSTFIVTTVRTVDDRHIQIDRYFI